ncbi:MAG: hypothetical protein B0D92_06740 [Spirochaeta sp. LUC14_002_19_P3]|nr:MAG: hypothetical protein B0D92_06740 [Spirochaeta sp. LUC14_002_19_P3]
MTLSIRRLLLTILLLASLAGLLLIGYTWFILITDNLKTSFSPGITMVWWGAIRGYYKTDLISTLGILTFYTVLALAGELILRRRFGVNQSSEMFFLRLFLLLLPLQAVRLTVLYHTDLGLTATRIAWFGRFTGITALLNISLYDSDMPIRRSAHILGVGVLVSMAIAVMIPLDVTQPMGNLLYRTGIDTSLALACILLEILAVISLAGSGVARMNNLYYLLAAALLSIIVGSELSFFGNATLDIIGALLMLMGTLGFAGLIRRIYQWL